MLLSGGVDSTVCTALLNKALNQDQVIAVHIDNGFMRKRESQSVEEALTKLGIKLKGRDKSPGGLNEEAFYRLNDIILKILYLFCL